ncbi:MAG: 2-amino-4-hydroxy-6-hydroxymethyldihydropteridine diphosphokinase [Acidimicrobiia bacterium]|nr:2-amino-4-hydroxy-6-hydroxymethyldihydropteridine diphosphokinase [Acidimicrobiia bacterium]
MIRAAVALGSNLGDRRQNLESAVEAMGMLGEVVAVSRLYETAPIGGPDQDAYLNAVAIVETLVPAGEFLTGLHAIEDRAGRKREVRWGPRTLDLDLVLYGSEEHSDEDCTVPHPRLLERRFVIEPLVDAWPEASLPDGRSVAAFLAGVADQEVVDLGPWWPGQGFHHRGGWWIVVQFGLIGLVVALVGVDGPMLPGGSFVKAFGAVLAMIGAVEGGLGLLQLGERLTPFPEPLDGGGVIHGGIYSTVRHPIYGGIVLGLIGMALFRLSVLGLAVAIGSGFFFWLKAGREEVRLTRRFPDYPDYRANTQARLIPWFL